jgi:hypothetical protein
MYPSQEVLEVLRIKACSNRVSISYKTVGRVDSLLETIKILDGESFSQI